MADRRSKRQKLQDMANQSVSPHEAEIAKKKLEEIGEEPPNQDWSGIFGRSFTYTVNFNPDSFRNWNFGTFDATAYPFGSGHVGDFRAYSSPDYSPPKESQGTRYASPFGDGDGSGEFYYDFKNEKWVKVE